jgi:hypothetical protein
LLVLRTSGLLARPQLPHALLFPPPLSPLFSPCVHRMSLVSQETYLFNATARQCVAGSAEAGERGSTASSIRPPCRFRRKTYPRGSTRRSARAACSRRAGAPMAAAGCACDCRTSEIELIAGDAMHDDGKLASHGDGGALHAPALGDGDTPRPSGETTCGYGSSAPMWFVLGSLPDSPLEGSGFELPVP